MNSIVTRRHRQKTEDPDLLRLSEACKYGDTEALKSLLGSPIFNPDMRDNIDRSGLQFAADASGENSDRSEIANLLIDALEKKYQKDPAALIKALGDATGDPLKKHFHPSHWKVQQRLEEIIRRKQYEMSPEFSHANAPDIMVKFAREGDKYVETMREFLTEKGMHPDARDEQGITALWHATVGAYTPSVEMTHVLIDALVGRYKDEPRKLLRALTDHPANRRSVMSTFEPSGHGHVDRLDNPGYDGVAKRLKAIIAAAEEAIKQDKPMELPRILSHVDRPEKVKDYHPRMAQPNNNDGYER